jgi:hypothetical protein
MRTAPAARGQGSAYAERFAVGVHPASLRRHFVLKRIRHDSAPLQATVAKSHRCLIIVAHHLRAINTRLKTARLESLKNGGRHMALASKQASAHVLTVCVLEWFENQYSPDQIDVDEDLKKRYFSMNPSAYQFLASPLSNLGCIRVLGVTIAKKDMGALTTIRKIVNFVIKKAGGASKPKKAGTIKGKKPASGTKTK